MSSKHFRMKWNMWKKAMALFILISKITDSKMDSSHYQMNILIMILEVLNSLCATEFKFNVQHSLYRVT